MRLCPCGDRGEASVFPPIHPGVPTSEKEVANGTFRKIKRDAGWK